MYIYSINYDVVYIMTAITLHLNYDQVEAKKLFVTLPHIDLTLSIFLAAASQEIGAREVLCAILAPPIASDRVASRKGSSANAASDILAKRTQCCPTPGVSSRTPRTPPTLRGSAPPIPSG
jgi:hypothetical protein